MVDHPLVRPLVGAGRTGRVAEQVADLLQLQAFGLGRLDDGLDLFVRRAGLGEDRRHAGLANERQQVLDVADAGLRGRRDALHAPHVQVVGGSEILERIVRGDHDPPALRDRLDPLADVLMQLRQPVLQRRGVGLERRRPVGIELGQRVHDRRDRLGPQRDVHPDVRVELAGRVLAVVGRLAQRDQPIGRQRRPDRDDMRLLLAQLGQVIGQGPLQPQAHVEDGRRLAAGDDVRRGRLVHMRVDAAAEQRAGVVGVAGDRRDQVAEHRHRRDQHRPGVGVTLGGCLAGPTASGERTDRQSDRQGKRRQCGQSDRRAAFQSR